MHDAPSTRYEASALQPLHPASICQTAIFSCQSASALQSPPVLCELGEPCQASSPCSLSGGYRFGRSHARASHSGFASNLCASRHVRPPRFTLSSRASTPGPLRRDLAPNSTRTSSFRFVPRAKRTWRYFSFRAIA